LRHFKQADPSDSAVYGITCLNSLRDKSLAGVPEQASIILNVPSQVHQWGFQSEQQQSSDCWPTPVPSLRLGRGAP